MIARSWTGVTRTSDAAAYTEYLNRTGVAGYLAVEGNRAVLLMRRDLEGGRTEFTMFTLWDDLEAIERFAGDEATTAVFYPEDDKYLVERDLTARHFEVEQAHGLG